ncbi:MAG TPA: hypothetical protein VK464_07545 [Symbiobacteriaceae bacterium]|nr:hypothetical protein [Symbiobacteriaceae bacterium]
MLHIKIGEGRVAFLGPKAAFVHTNAASGHRIWVKVPISPVLRTRLKARDQAIMDLINRMVDQALNNGQDLDPDWFLQRESS